MDLLQLDPPHPLPATFIGVTPKPWQTMDLGTVIQPIGEFQLPSTVMGYNLLSIGKILVSREEDGMGTRAVFLDGRIQCNMLIMSLESLNAYLEAWTKANNEHRPS
jgi:hypothetical protein